MRIFEKLVRRPRGRDARTEERDSAQFIPADQVGARPEAHVDSGNYHVVFDGGFNSYSIAIGTWRNDDRIGCSKDGMRTILFRWNGTSDHEFGYPTQSAGTVANQRNRAGWLPLPPEFAPLILDLIADKKFEYWTELLDG